MEIPQELDTFRKTVSAGKDTMTSTITTLQDKLKVIMDATSTAQSEFEANYQSENKTKIVNKLSKISMIADTINSSLTSDLTNILNKAQSVIDKIGELDDINAEIDRQNEIISTQNNSENPNRTTISAANSRINSEKNKFNTTVAEANRMLTELRGMDASLSFVEQFSNSDYTAYLDQLQYGTFEKQSYKAKNGVTVNYWIYVPDYGQDVEGLPVHLYLHGSGETGSGVLNCGLPKLIKEESITPSGIVICLQASTTSDFYNANYQDAVIELCDNVVETYNADSNKISLSGHSMGAIAGYKMVTNYPNYFSAFVPISGLSFNGEQLKDSDTEIWIFHGANDSSCEYSNAVKTYNYLTSNGKHVNFYTYQNKGHGDVQNLTFMYEYENDDGESYNPLEWAFEQSLEDKA